MAEKLKFEYGQPLELALKFNNGKNVPGKFGDQVLFTTVDDTVFYLDPEPASEVEHQLDELGIKAREFFRIIKTRHPRGGGSSFRIERLPSPETELVRQLEGSLALASRSRNGQALSEDKLTDAYVPPVRRPPVRATENGAPADLWRGTEQREARTFGSSAPPMAMTNHTNQPGPLATGPANRLENQGITPVNSPISQKLMAAFCASIDVVVEATIYAQRRGLALHFKEEDIRAIAITAFIQTARG